MFTNGKKKIKNIGIIFHLFYLATYMDSRIKVKGIENILNIIATCMNQPSEPEGKAYEQLNTLYKYYETKYDSVSSSAITPCAFGNYSFFMQLAKGKRQVGPSSRCNLSKYLDTDYFSYYPLMKSKILIL